jgi:hypothetical protein
MRRVSLNSSRFFHFSKTQFAKSRQRETNELILVPQIFFNEKHIGGRDDFKKLDEKELQDLIKYVQEYEPPENAPSIPETSRLLSVGDEEGEGALRCEYDTDADIAKALKARVGTRPDQMDRPVGVGRSVTSPTRPDFRSESRNWSVGRWSGFWSVGGRVLVGFTYAFP